MIEWPIDLCLTLCCVPGGDATYNFKTLVPAAAAGAIIGKGGDAIGQVQKETGAKVKMSKSQDFYPGALIFFILNVS